MRCSFTLSTTRRRALALVLALAGPTPAAAATTAETSTTRHPSAVAAYTAALAHIERHEYTEAITKLDLATELEPTWSDPVRQRAEVFAALADRHHPSAAFMTARMADLQRLQALEPGVDTVARQREIAALQRQSRAAAEVEQRRRSLSPLAVVAATVTGSLLVGGAMLYAMKPNQFLLPTAFRHERRTTAGLAMLIAGAALVTPTIVIGVLAGRQARRDSALRDFNVATDRPRADFGVSPQYVAGGGGLGLRMRF